MVKKITDSKRWVFVQTAFDWKKIIAIYACNIEMTALTHQDLISYTYLALTGDMWERCITSNSLTLLLWFSEVDLKPSTGHLHQLI